ncbi:transcription factor TFIIH complex subunit Tfb5-domain-containing protein [Jackrogersella minutella]|nr:transcription factor TFIIH complex subunit Tfb5-domain-containing protein [Jackrogersella minutella]
MVRAIKGLIHSFSLLYTYVAYLDIDMHLLGTLVKCDPSIKSIIISIDAEDNEYIIEDLDESHLVVKDNMVAQLKTELDKRLRENVPEVEDDSDSDQDVK